MYVVPVSLYTLFLQIYYIYTIHSAMQILEETLKKSKAITNLQDETNEKSAGKHFYKNIFKK